MAGTEKRLAGPAYISNAAANIYNPSAGVIGYVRQIHIVNTDTVSRTFSLYIGATGGSAGGTELEGTYTIAANTDWDRYFPRGLKLISTDFLTGVASVASKLVITVMGEEIS